MKLYNSTHKHKHTEAPYHFIDFWVLFEQKIYFDLLLCSVENLISNENVPYNRGVLLLFWNLLMPHRFRSAVLLIARTIHMCKVIAVIMLIKSFSKPFFKFKETFILFLKILSPKKQVFLILLSVFKNLISVFPKILINFSYCSNWFTKNQAKKKNSRKFMTVRKITTCRKLQNHSVKFKSQSNRKIVFPKKSSKHPYTFFRLRSITKVVSGTVINPSWLENNFSLCDII